MNSKRIITLVKDIKETWNTNDPYKIAERLGIVVLHTDNKIKDFTAHTIKVPGYPTIISINNSYTELSKKLLCAHELAHAILHEECINHFATTNANIACDVEHEANLFAIALLAPETLDKELSIPLTGMNNSLLKTIIDYNLKLN
ncbi:MAG: ImmA/IrrE family metallo-endopeptidase [Lachnospiraceae bacterium]|nr:ImmA/IrrE family metallo-endopeptidase [Lachnospiraceae bacterium]